MSSRIFKASYLVLIAITFTLISACSDKKAPPPPNIVWLVSEDNSAYWIGAYGNEVAVTPNIDGLAETGVVYNHAIANAPVCSPARNTIITGRYANSNGNHQMRSNYKAPEFVRFFPEYLREAGYYTTNNKKEDYNTSSAKLLKGQAWDESSDEATYKNRKPGQPFFHVQNYGATHESSLFDSIPDDKLAFDPDEMEVFPYHPNTPDFRHDYAQYYQRHKQLDDQIGQFLDDLKNQRLYDSTIVFYYGDHGGVLPRGKRYIFESGIRVPMIVHVPEMYRHLMPDEIGSHSERIVSFVDLASTILNAVGIEIPEHMQGRPFLGENVPESKDYAFVFRGRMGERYDLMHGVRSRKYLYIRNYYPERIYGQHLEYLWMSRAIRDWERLHREGKLNEFQSAYWETKPYEELYDIVNDPHNIQNLAENPEYADVLAALSHETDKWIAETQPIDVLPEPLMHSIDKATVLYDSVKGENFQLMEIHEVARMSARAAKQDFETLYHYTKDENPVIAFWGIKAMFQYGDELKSSGLLDELKENLSHTELYIQNLTANVLLSLGEKQDFKQLILEGVNSDNGFNRLEALQLYEKLERDKDIDARIKERYENDIRYGAGNERNVYRTLYNINE
jgi:N-sulfoglucosamine sulfohydrolase